MRKKKEGGASVFILGMFVILMCFVTFLYIFQTRMIGYVRDEFDNGLLMALMGAATINVEEYGRSGQRVIHETYTGEEGGFSAPENAVYPDEYLDGALEKAERYLNENLNLAADGASGQPIVGTVTLEEFKVFNVYRDESGRKQIYEFSWDGNWSEVTHAIGETVYVSGAGDRGKGRAEVEDTTVYAKISFDISIFPYLGGMQENEHQKLHVTMERSVSVPEN